MDVEALAVSAVKESIARTDVLSPFIPDKDKEPSWDGHIYIYTDRNKTKKGLKRVPVQVKGVQRKSTPQKRTPKFPVSRIDLDNWLNDGGVILFVVYMDSSGEKKTIYYCSLLPVKIRHIESMAQGKHKIGIPLSMFPDENNQKVSLLLDFYSNMQKQTSFANSPLYSMEELEKRGVLEGISFSVSTYGAQKTERDIDLALLQNEIYMYATIKGSSVPQPLPDTPMDLHIMREKQGDIKIGDQVFYHNYRIIRSVAELDITIGSCMTLKISPDKKNVTLNYRVNGKLSDCIWDTECLIALFENETISINGAPFRFSEIKKAEIEQYRGRLSYYKDIKKMLDLLGSKRELECGDLSDQDERNLRIFTNAMVYGQKIEFSECKDTMVYGRYKLANLVLLIWADRNAEYGYRLQNFFSNHNIALFENGDSKMEHPFPITHYALLKKRDFLEAANIDYNKIVEDLSKCDDSPIVTEQITLFMLEMLKAYDENADEELLAVAEKYCDWLIENSEDSNELFTLNKLQIIRRKREFELAEKQTLERLRKSDYNLSIRCAANLLLGKTEAAQECFNEMDEQEKERFVDYPICRFGNLT